MNYKDLNLDKLGFIDNGGEILRNLPIERIIEEGLVNGETKMAMNGAVMVDTGIYTGRSPNDKFFVEENFSKDNLWWGPVNRPVKDDVFKTLLDKVLDRDVHCNFYEDNQAAILILENGGSSALRHVGRTHRVDLAWMYERFNEDNIKVRYIESNRQCADIYTKHFTDRYKWYQSLILINHYPNFHSEAKPVQWTNNA